MSRLRLLRGGAGCALLAAALLLAGAAQAATSEPWPAVALPPHAKAEWVSDDMKVDGIPMRVVHFETSASRAEVVTFYTAHWTGGYSTKPGVQTLPDATIVGQAHGPYFMTVKVSDRPRSGSEGYLSVSQMLGNRAERSAGGLPLFPGAKILSVVETNDPGRQSRDLTAEQDAGFESAAGWYEAALVNAGWHAAQKTASDPRSGAAGYIELFRRGEDELTVSVMARSGERGSTVVENLVTKGTGRPRE